MGAKYLCLGASVTYDGGEWVVYGYGCWTYTLAPVVRGSNGDTVVLTRSRHLKHVTYRELDRLVASQTTPTDQAPTAGPQPEGP